MNTQTKIINSSSVFLFTVSVLIIIAIVWASKAKLDEVARATGRVIPSRQVQIIQNLEGGILSELNVKIGDIVNKGDILLKLDDTNFASTFRENKARRDSIMAKKRRLEAEVNDLQKIDFSSINDNLATKAEKELFIARKAKFNSTKAVLEKQKKQKEQEIVELRSRINNLKKSLDLALEEQSILEPMVKKGVTSRIELIRAERQSADLRQKIESSELAIPRAQSSLEEAIRRIDEHQTQFVSEGRKELTEVQLRLKVIDQSINSVKDRFQRTEVRSPVFGTVKRIMINTVTGVIKPGMNLVEIVPLDDTLLIEAKVKPADVAFIRPGQSVKVRLTAYDFGKYGSLDGKLENISADAIIDQNGESYFQARIRTTKNFIGKNDSKLAIIPGMIAEIDILTGRKTVLEYFIEPIKEIREHAFKEN
ncbi:HlyD family type I secretion periplasmic adaptor subunit [Alphaproteobacteria bacterium]|nr:HlyD family type I secretion periplasmic adaptor subunit [Alphaproteobacteria bacterium]